MGPITVDLRDDLVPGAKVVGRMKHGDRVAILHTRRRFVKVRTASGVEGWTEVRRLLTPEQMEELNDLSGRAAKLPSMGRATVYDTLNMHAEPNRHATSFYQIAPGATVDVLAHRAAERSATPPPPVPIVKKAPPPPARMKPRRESKTLPLPKPPVPALPPNWMELSKTDLPEEIEPEAEAEENKRAHHKPKIHIDDWTFVRAQNGKAGWVLSGMLLMSIPDEVAQYSEGARITSYFELGSVDDEGVPKRHWLWTTSSRTGMQYDFDSFRVFIWNRKKHRYETSYIERGVEGYFPVDVQAPKFTVLLRRQNGSYYTKSFALDGYLTRWLGSAEAQPPHDPLVRTIISRGPPAPAVPAAQNSPGFVGRVKAWTKRVLNRS
ncbi:MAG TPA: SH3 domain-containing protein [Bryobacteraceae bacterium]|nr:SH3 domain-containing protein [Bryobacteraceae bacterium]